MPFAAAAHAAGWNPPAGLLKQVRLHLLLALQVLVACCAVGFLSSPFGAVQLRGYVGRAAAVV